MGILSQTLNKMANNPVHTFRGIFPAWKNGIESSMQGSGSSSIDHGIIAGIISPLVAGTTEKAFSYIPSINEDNIKGNSLKSLKTIATPAAASTACFAAVTAAKTILGTTVLAASASAAAPILAGGAVVAGGGFILSNIIFKSPEQASPDGQDTKLTKISDPSTTIFQKAKNMLDTGLRTTAGNGANAYKTIFPANLTFLGATFIGGFSLGPAAAIGMIGGLASAKTAQVTQKAYNNSSYVKMHIEEDSLRGKFLKAGKTVVPALAASSAAIAAPAGAILGTSALASATVISTPVIAAGIALAGGAAYAGKLLFNKISKNNIYQNNMTNVSPIAIAEAKDTAKPNINHTGLGM